MNIEKTQRQKAQQNCEKRPKRPKAAFSNQAKICGNQRPKDLAG